MKFIVKSIWFLMIFIVAVPVQSKIKYERELVDRLRETMMKINHTTAGCKTKELRSMAEIQNCGHYDRVMEDLNIRESFLKLWQASGIGRPLSQRVEQGGWIVSNGNDGYEVIPFPEKWPASPCSISYPDNFLDIVPDGLVGVVHTHPFLEGDDTTGPDVCGEEAAKSYESGGNFDDLDFLVRIANHLSDFCINGYVIDGNNLVIMNTKGYMNFYPVNQIFQRVNS